LLVIAEQACSRRRTYIKTAAVLQQLAFVASPLSSGITGAALRVYGGVVRSVF
jgi:hypothetical protein